jgi:protein subunit release factor A
VPATETQDVHTSACTAVPRQTIGEVVINPAEIRIT